MSSDAVREAEEQALQFILSRHRHLGVMALQIRQQAQDFAQQLPQDKIKKPPTNQTCKSEIHKDTKSLLCTHSQQLGSCRVREPVRLQRCA